MWKIVDASWRFEARTETRSQWRGIRPSEEAAMTTQLKEGLNISENITFLNIKYKYYTVY